MSQVVDASVVVAALTDASATGRWSAEQMARDELVAPHLMPFEVANVLRRMVAREALPVHAGSAALKDLGDLTVDLVPFELLSDRVWQLRADLTCYDASYVAAAEVLRCPLLTLDERLARAPGLGCEIRVAP